MLAQRLRKGVNKDSPIELGKTTSSPAPASPVASPLYVSLKPLIGLHYSAQRVDTWIRVNDPSAGSPTETLLRLLLPLNDQV